MHRPHQELGVEIVVGELLRGVALAPLAEAVNHLAEFLASLGQLIRATPAGRERGTLDHARVLELAEALSQERARDQRHPAADLVEATRAGEQLAQDQRCPPFGKDLGGDGDRAELTVSLHGPTLVSRRAPRKSIFWSWRLSRALPPCSLRRKHHGTH